MVGHGGHAPLAVCAAATNPGLTATRQLSWAISDCLPSKRALFPGRVRGRNNKTTESNFHPVPCARV
jgi:hypothetical protein